MNNFVVVGCGNLGSRHIQGLAAFNTASNIYAIDPYSDALKLTQKRFQDVNNSSQHNLFLYKNISELPKSIDIAIIASGSNIRLNLLKELLESKKVKYLILEKFLFQSKNEFKEAIELTDKYSVPTWVNCARRYFKHYTELKNMLNRDSRKTISFTAENWGLACNAIHFVDIFSYVIQEKLKGVTSIDLDNKIYNSKREGYIEFMGSLTLEYEKGSKLTLNCLHKTSEHEIILKTSNKVYLINEREGHASWDNQKINIDILNVSDITTLIVNDLLRSNSCKLPKLIKSTHDHLLLLEAFKSFAEKIENKPIDRLAIT